METLRSILQEIDQEDWLVAIDIKDAYLHIPVASSHQNFLRFLFLGKHFQYQSLPDLDDILIKAKDPHLLVHQRNYVLKFLQHHGWKINFNKSHLRMRISKIQCECSDGKYFALRRSVSV